MQKPLQRPIAVNDDMIRISFISTDLIKILLVDESVRSGRPVDELFGLKPKRDFFLGRFDGVGSVDDVTAEIETKVTADGTRKRSLGIGFTHHHSASLGSVLAFPNHRHNGARGHEVAKSVVEGLVLEIDVVLLEMLFGSLHELHSDEFESSLLESFDDVTDESALNSIGLHHDESAFRISGHVIFVKVFFRRSKKLT